MSISFMSEVIKNDIELVEIAIEGAKKENIPEIVSKLSIKTKKNPNIILKSVSKNGLALQHADPDLQNNFDIVYAAVRQDGKAL